ncbi:MAG: hypothetical protein P1U89_27380 [Verrucomicrobiales bacterium]|nr:hypothetical protein [Verrucomicrobiales bacterium]
MDDFLWLNYTEGSQYGSGRDTARAASAAAEANSDIRTLTAQVDRLALACQAMWEIVRDQTDLTEKDLADKISEIDLRDGVEDGKIGTKVIKCESCGRNSNSKRQTCLWCGEPVERQHAFEG